MAAAEFHRIGLVPDTMHRVQAGPEDYRRAEWFRREGGRRLVFRDAVEPHWINGSDRLWYRVATPEGARAFAVDPGTGAKTEIADPGPADEPTTPNGTMGVPSPDGRWLAFADGYDIQVMSLPDGHVRPLTRDGERHNAYGTVPDTAHQAIRIARGTIVPRPLVLWSPDSRRLLVVRTDQRRVRSLPLFQSVVAGRPSDGPVLHEPRIPVPGDPYVTQAELVLFDAASGERRDVQAPPLMALYDILQIGLVWWDGDSQKVYFIAEERGFKTFRLCVADATTGTCRTILEERGATHVQPAAGRYPPTIRCLRGGSQIIHFSERDGWGHLYLSDGATGAVIRQLTFGPWTVHGIAHVDEDARFVYFTAGGREADRDPYYAHLYRLRLDGGGEPELLTPEDGHHTIRFSPTGGVFVDTWSRADKAPVTLLRRADGRLVSILEESDVSRLLATGWRWPERFRVTARDGVTDLYGVLYRPSTFDPSLSYPILDHIYGAGQRLQAQAGFAIDGYPIEDVQCLAELGFLVIVMDGMGTPFRSKAFHDAGHCLGFGEGGGIVDHVGAIRQLAERYPYIDLDRVGIYGFSGGGYGAARAILQHPDFFKVAVAGAGSHDQRLYNIRFGERYIGLLDEQPEAYAVQANETLVENLKGKLLLVTGDLDEDVHPAITLRLADALIRAGKRFDLFVMPGQGHEMDEAPYFLKMRWDYFVRHLQGVEPDELR